MKKTTTFRTFSIKIHLFTKKVSLLYFWVFLPTSLWATPLLSDYPSSKRLWLGHVKTEFQPSQNLNLQAKSTGDIHILVENGEHIPSEGVCAIFQPDRIDVETKSLQLDRILLEQKLQTMEIEHEEKSIQLLEQTSEIETTISKLNAVAKSPEAKDSLLLRKRISQALNQTKSQLEYSKKRLNLHQSKTSYQAERDKLKLDFSRKEMELKKLKQSSEYTSPFAGRFHLDEEFRKNNEEKKSKYWVEAGIYFGVITNESQYQVKVTASSPIITQNKPKHLTLTIPIPGSEDCHATFLRSKRPKGTRNDTLIFQVIENDLPLAKKIGASTPYAQVYLDLPEEAHLVSKKDILNKVIGNQMRGNWGAMVKELWPNAEVTAIGHRELAISTARK